MTRPDPAKVAAREPALDALRAVARPDHRHHWDLGEFIADFDGSAAATDRVTAWAAYADAAVVFATPDNCLRRLRERALLDGKRLLVATCGIGRGFLALDGSGLSPVEMALASTMEAIDELARPVTLAAIARSWRPDLLVTGALAVTAAGLRLGKGRGYFDLEFAMLREADAVAPDVAIAAVVHDVQVIEGGVPVRAHDVVVDVIATPTRAIRTGRMGPRTAALEWERLDEGTLRSTPPLAELAATRGR